MNRAALVIFSAIVGVLAICSFCDGFSASWGQRTPTDILLKREFVLRRPLVNNYWNASVEFPLKVNLFLFLLC